MFAPKPTDGDDLLIVDTVLTHDERIALEVILAWGIVQTGWNSCGPGKGTDEPLYTACRRLGLDVSGLDERVGQRN